MNKQKPKLVGMENFFAIFFYTALICWLLSEILIANNLILPKAVLAFWITILIVEVIGIVRKSGRLGDTLSESLWHAAKNYWSRRVMTAILGLGIGFRIISFGWLNLANNPEYGVFRGDLFNYGGIVIWGLAFIVWIIPHFLYSGKRG